MPAPLVLDGQRSARTRTGWCGRVDVELRYLVGTGSDKRLVRPRCKRRDCPRCWSLRSRETARCLVLDARARAPRYCMTLTTRTPWTELRAETFRHGMANVARRLRRQVGAVDYFAAVEFTTGRAARSGGHRRMHAHALLKVDTGRELDVRELERDVASTWRRSTGAWRVELAELVSPGAALGYLGLHHRKPSQAPPDGWRGMSERASRGYWSSPIGELRARARAELRVEARMHVAGMSRAEAELELELEDEPELRRYRRHHGSQLLEPHGPVDFGAQVRTVFDRNVGPS